MDNLDHLSPEKKLEWLMATLTERLGRKPTRREMKKVMSGSEKKFFQVWNKGEKKE